MTNGNNPSPVVRFFGWLLMAVGALIIVTAGACTVFVLGSMLMDGGAGNTPYFGRGEMLGMVAVVGGVPLAVGVGLFFGGRAISRPRVTKRDWPRHD